MVPFLINDFWVRMSDTAWFQALLTVVTATIAARLTYAYGRRGDKQQEINQALATMSSAGRQYRSAYIAFLEFDIAFQDQLDFLAVALKKDKRTAIGIHQQGAFSAQETAQEYRKLLVTARDEFTHAAFLLTAYINGRLANTDFQKHVNGVLNVVQPKTSDFHDAKNEIEEQLQPHLQELEALCMRISWEQNTPVIIVYYQKCLEYLKKYQVF